MICTIVELPVPITITGTTNSDMFEAEIETWMS
jgi:hypothetical protein